MPVLAGVLFIVLVLAVVLIAGVIRKYSLSDERADQMAYFGLEADDEVAVILQNEQAELHGLLIDGQPYVNFETVQNSLNSRFYWDANENQLLYALPDNLVKVPVGSSEYYIGKDRQNFNYNIVKTEGNDTYVALDFVKQYTDLEYQLYDSPNRVEILYQWGTQNVATLKDDEAVRQKAGIKSPILTDGKKGDTWNSWKTGPRLPRRTVISATCATSGWAVWRRRSWRPPGISRRRFTRTFPKIIRSTWHGIT